jgi:hypothetical protein
MVQVVEETFTISMLISVVPAAPCPVCGVICSWLA